MRDPASVAGDSKRSALYWAVSLFIVCHLTAVTVGSLPEATTPQENQTGSLDAAAKAASRVVGAIHALDPLTAFTRTYLRQTGLREQWVMFANPPQDDQYVRVRYYVGPVDAPAGAQPSWMATELVMPAHREDRLRLLQSFRDSYQDKAIAIALQEFYRKRRPAAIRPDTNPERLPDDLAPIARYFAGRFTRLHLDSGERVVRTEVWVGSAPTPRRPSDASLTRSATRIALLRGYYEGPVESRLRVAPYPPYHAADDEGDIRWLLEYFEAR